MSDNNDIMNKLKTITKQNIKSLTEQGVLYADDKLQKIIYKIILSKIIQKQFL